MNKGMNKPTLLTIGRKLQDGNLYLISVFDCEPSGVVIQAYDQMNSKEFILPVSELELLTADISREQTSLSKFIGTIDLVPQGSGLVLQSSNDKITKIHQRLVGSSLETHLKANTLGGGTQSINELIVTGLVELCKVKPVGIDAVQWLGEWLLENNPNKPNVSSPDDE